MKTVRYAFESALLYVLFVVFRVMPVDIASSIGGWLGRTIGPRLATSRKAQRNLENALPDLSEQEQAQVIRKMWDNLGRVVAEYPHLEYIGRHRTKIENKNVLDHLISSGAPAVFIGAHLGNWETACSVMLTQFNMPLHLTYRAPNNPWVDKLLYKVRTLGGQIKAYAKSRGAGRDMFRALKNGEYIGILIDQKYNEGVAVPFFGQEAMTNPAPVQLCQKFGCPLIPVRYQRLEGAWFKVTAHDLLEVFDEAGASLPVENVLGEIHTLLETWIKDDPGQWLWLHRRWG